MTRAPWPGPFDGAPHPDRSRPEDHDDIHPVAWAERVATGGGVTDGGTPPPFPAIIEREMPQTGPCGLCGGPDARHRVLDAIWGGASAGDSALSLADDYGYSVEFIAYVILHWDQETETFQ